MKKYIIVILVTAVIMSAMWIGASMESEQAVLNVSAVFPQKKNIYDYIVADGRIKEGTRRDIYTRYPGEITKIYVSEGDTVKKGSPLFEIESVEKEYFEKGVQIDEKAILSVFEEYGFNIPDEDIIAFASTNETISSPIEGTITDINVNEGDYTTIMKKLISISDFSDLYVEARIPEEHSGKILPGAETSISAAAFGDATFIGRVERVAPVAKYVPSLTGDGKTYITAEIRTNEGKGMLKPELTVDAKIAVNRIENALTIPYECVRQDDEGNEYVYTVEDSKLSKKVIRTGYELENEIQVVSGIKEDSVVVYEPLDNFEESSFVNVVNITEKR